MHGSDINDSGRETGGLEKKESLGSEKMGREKMGREKMVEFRTIVGVVIEC